MKTLNINREINLAEHSKFLKRLLLILINKIGKIIHKIHIHNFHVRIMINRLESRSENNLIISNNCNNVDNFVFSNQVFCLYNSILQSSSMIKINFT